MKSDDRKKRDQTNQENQQPQTNAQATTTKLNSGALWRSELQSEFGQLGLDLLKRSLASIAHLEHILAGSFEQLTDKLDVLIFLS